MKKTIIMDITNFLKPLYHIMSNEKHIEEMYYFAHISGVFREFSNEVNRIKNNTPEINFYEVVEDVFNEFVNEGLIETELHLFI